ncbi:MAG: hypothetical protein ACRC78_26610, partial [Planktothrix sp.]
MFKSSRVCVYGGRRPPGNRVNAMLRFGYLMFFARLRQNGYDADSIVGSLAIPLGMGSGVLWQG